jgi:hypothetical protein
MKRAFLIYLIAAASFGGLSVLETRAIARPVQQQKSNIIQQIKASSAVRINADNSQGSQLYIREATVKEISGDEFTRLTGEAPRHFRQATFPEVTLFNNSSKTIKSFALVAKSATEDSQSGYILLKKNLSILPGTSYKVASSEWPQAERVSTEKDGKFMHGVRQPGLDSAKSWIPGAASDLRVTVGLVAYEDGTGWKISRDSNW